jgi:RNA polymerase sigma factor (sigma-70 family)
MSLVKADAESDLVARLGRDQSALEELIASHYQAVHRLVRRLSGRSADPDDLTQDVFVSALANARRFRAQSSVSTWLTRIAINVCRAHRRRSRIRLAFWVGKAREGDCSRRVLDPSESAEHGEEIRRLKDALMRLGGNYREVIVLHYLEQLCIGGVCEVLGLSRPAVEVRLHRVRRMLAELMRDG